MLFVAATLLILVSFLLTRAGSAEYPAEPPGHLGGSAPVKASALETSGAIVVVPAPGKNEEQGKARERVGGDAFARWSWHPRGLGGAVAQELDHGSGSKAVLLGRQVRACAWVNDTMEDTRSDLNVPIRRGAESLQAQRRQDASARIQELGRIQQDCSSLVGDPMQVSQRLFEQAARAGVVGAAVEYDNPRRLSAELLDNVAKDARLGDLKSMAAVGSFGVNTFGTSDDEARAYALAVLRLQGSDNQNIAEAARRISAAMLTAMGFGHKKVASYLMINGVPNSIRSVVSNPPISPLDSPVAIKLESDLVQAALILDAQRKSAPDREVWRVR
jgi:hypothetical protein